VTGLLLAAVAWLLLLSSLTGTLPALLLPALLVPIFLALLVPIFLALLVPILLALLVPILLHGPISFEWKLCVTLCAAGERQGNACATAIR